MERVGSQPKGIPRFSKHAKALRIGRLQVFDIIKNAPRSTPPSVLRHVVNTAFVTDVLNITAYSIVPILECPEFSLVVKDGHYAVPSSWETMVNIMDICVLILKYRVLSGCV